MIADDAIKRLQEMIDDVDYESRWSHSVADRDAMERILDIALTARAVAHNHPDCNDILDHALKPIFDEVN